MVTTLTNFGVPDGAGARRGILQAKVKYKFRVVVFGFGNEGASNRAGFELTRQVQSIGRPQVQSQSVAVHSYNSIGYYAGKPEWQTITMSVIDDVTNNVSRIVGYQEQKQMNHIQQVTPLAAVDYKFLMKIETLTGGNADAVIETWTLEGCFLESIQYDQFDYTTSEPMKIEMNIRYDNAIQEQELMPTNVPYNPTLKNMTGGRA
jgi:hypothetical protein